MIWLFLDDGLESTDSRDGESYRGRVVRDQARPGQRIVWCPTSKAGWRVSPEVQSWMDQTGVVDYELRWTQSSLATRANFDEVWMVGLEDPRLAMLFKLRWAV